MSDGLRIAYAEAGAGLAVVFLHGVGSTKDVWRSQVDHFSTRGMRCIAAEYRGYGDSDVPPPASLAAGAADAQAISRAAFARDVLAVLDACGVSAAHFCGCSLGGVVSLDCYAQAPERVRSLTLVDTFAFYPGGVESMHERIDTLERLGMLEFARSRASGVLRPDALPERVERVRAEMGSIRLDVYKAATRATWTGDYRALLPRITVPVLVVWGEHDRDVAPRALSEEIVALTRSARALTVIPDAGHVPNVDNPRAFNEALEGFWRSL
jgi:3-oxoadipate enol-lactonase